MKSSLLEVWGDTVDSRHLCGAIGLGLTIAGSLYLAADQIMPSLVDDRTLAHSYALLIGLIGCLVAAVIAAKLFRRSARSCWAPEPTRQADVSRWTRSRTRPVPGRSA
ncbi:hypothetical protein [Aeromicrobium sp. UC242_57]|uniref:hypothetical protein n=1 Tax=Aeromicrobium sp. UC242_57 TaxID=3374624 RepID=UPI0037A7AACA